MLGKDICSSAGRYVGKTLLIVFFVGLIVAILLIGRIVLREPDSKDDSHRT